MKYFSLASVKETRNPIKPVNISVRINPTRVNTRTSSFVTVNSVEKIRTEVNSRVPIPARVIGIKPTTFASGKSNIKI